jgi:short subunit dehydrogenase-like uncharacterized protein
MSQYLIYGANGFTGKLIVQEALQRGMKPILAGRNAKALKALADDTGLETRVFDLKDPETIASHLADVDAVLHAAGPFTLTMPPMVKACLSSKTHYLDITGEIDVFEKIYAQHDEACHQGVALIPGVGFDVVPTDCVAKNLAEALPDATHLALSFRALGGISRGTLQTAIYHMDGNSWQRAEGELRPTKNEMYKGSTFGTDDKINFMGIPWGDLSSAFRSTQIPNIITAMATSPKQADKMKQMRLFMPIAKIKPVNALLRKIVSRTVTGPSEEKQNTSISYVYGRAKNSRGHVETRALQCCEAYRLTAKTAVHAVDQLLKSNDLKGALTPSLAFGKDFLFDVPGAKAAWLN